MASAPFAIPGATNLQHVIPAHAGTHPDAANPGPGGGGPVGRRDRRGDDVGGVERGCCIAFLERLHEAIGPFTKPQVPAREPGTT